MAVHDRIISNPAVMAGKPVIAGTRITVEFILRELGAGASPDAPLKSFPQLTQDDLRAAQAFAADRIANEGIVCGRALRFSLTRAARVNAAPRCSWR